MARIKENKNRKKSLAILLLIFSLILITGILYALLSDRSEIAFSNGASNLKLNKSNEAKMKYYMVDEVEESEEFTDIVTNLKPNDIIDVRI